MRKSLNLLLMLLALGAGGRAFAAEPVPVAAVNLGFANSVRYEIMAPAAGTFDAVMSNGGAKYAFVDFSTARPAPETGWIFAPIVMRSWGQNSVTLTPALGYDGVLCIDTVTPPEYR